MKKITIVLSGLLIVLMTSCTVQADPLQELDDIVIEAPEDDAAETMPSDTEADSEENSREEESSDNKEWFSDSLEGELFSEILPEEFMAGFKGHKMESNNNPLLGAYVTTAGCIIGVLPMNMYSWQDSPDDKDAITGVYEIYKGTFDGQKYVLESKTGPLYTLIITFISDNASMPGTVQVFDYQSEGLYYVTDLIGNIWFEASQIKKP